MENDNSIKLDTVKELFKKQLKSKNIKNIDFINEDINSTVSSGKEYL